MDLQSAQAKLFQFDEIRRAKLTERLLKTLANDQALKKDIPAEKDSQCLVQDCQDPHNTTTHCPSCHQRRDERQDASTLSYFSRRGNLNPTTRQFQEKRAGFKGKDAHCVVPQTLIKRQTKALTAEFLEHKTLPPSPCVLVEDSIWPQFAEFYKARMLKACGEELKESKIRDRVRSMREEEDQDLSVSKERLAVLGKQWELAASQPKGPPVIEIYESDLATDRAKLSKMLAELPSLGNDERANLALKSLPVTANGVPVKDFEKARLIPGVGKAPLLGVKVSHASFVDNRLILACNEESAMVVLKPGSRPVTELAALLPLDKQRENFVRLKASLPVVADEPQIEKLPDDAVRFTAFVAGRKQGSGAFYIKEVDKTGTTTLCVKHTYILNASNEPVLLHEKDKLAVEVKQDQVPWIAGLFSNIMGNPFTVETQCAYCEELQGSDTFIQRVVYHQKYPETTPIGYVGIHLLKAANGDPVGYTAKWLEGVTEELKQRIQKACEDERAPKTETTPDAKSDAKSDSSSTPVAKTGALTEASDSEMDDAIKAAWTKQMTTAVELAKAASERLKMNGKKGTKALFGKAQSFLKQNTGDV